MPSGIAFVDRLADGGHRPALLDATAPGPDGLPGVVTYADLAARVAAAADALGAVRRLVLVEAVNSVDCLVTYLAALAGRHPVLLAAGDAARQRLVDRYDPDVVARPADDGGWSVEERRPGTAHDLHPDLALLLGTSGSAGSPKLVRLGAAAVDANAAAVAAALGLSADDRAVTTLPLAYCYGLSVVHSHLLRHAGVVVSPHSVLDEAFWALLEHAGVTTLAGVPWTFDLLDRAGLAERPAPALRLVTQAGGRLPPDRVRGYAALGARRGWEFAVMYGQTEATARMAVLPPALAASRPQAVGRPVPGGSFRVLEPDGDRPVPPGEVGEIVYSGANVMLGYAHGPADLALGRTTTDLRTGDLGRLAPDGLLEVTGRCSALVKVAGIRVDLDHVEAELADLGLVACATGGDDRVEVAVEGCAHPGMVRSLLASELSLAAAAIRVVAVEALPRRENGKPDRPAVRALLAADAAPAPRPASAPPATAAPQAPATGVTGDVLVARLVALYAELLDRPDADATSTFVGLGGDSLSYVALCVRLEEELGTLPADWHTRPVRELARAGRVRRPLVARVETGVVLRAAAIVAVVGTHAGLFTVRGGAHLLLAVAGFNAARFTFAAPTVREHTRRLGRSLGRLAVPTTVWVGALAVLGVYPWTSAVYLNALLGPDRWGPAWHFWFVEALVWILVVAGGLLCVPVVRRARAASPFGLALALVAVGLAPRFDLVSLWTGSARGTPQYIFWIFAIGWAAAEATTRRQRLLLTAVTLATVPGFFGNGARDAVVAGGIVLLVWVPTLRVPRVAVPLLGLLAGASLHIYLTHWQVYPLLDGSPLLGLLAALLAGVLLWAVAERVRRALAPVTSRSTTRGTTRSTLPDAATPAAVRLPAHDVRRHPVAAGR